MSHYYTNDYNLKNAPRDIEYTFLNEKVRLYSDNGVFSKNRIDFGTNVLLNSLEDLSNINKVIDVGCGIGIIGISIAKKYPNTSVVMIDINKRAIELANKNIIYNKINNIKAVESSLYEKVRESDFDLVISNPPIRAGKQVVHRIVEEGMERLKKNGMIYVVIQKKQGAESLKNKMELVFGNVTEVNKKNGYMIYKSVKI